MKKIVIKILKALRLHSFAIGIENKLTTFIKKPERKKFYGQFINQHSLCFDVGANMGNRTAIFLELGAKVVAIEPQQECYLYLQNKYGDKIELVTKGLGEKESTEKLYLSELSAISSFSKDHINNMQNDRFKGTSWNKTVEIEMTTMDNLIQEFGVPDFCKIDVEGYEYDVIKGLSQPIKVLSLEYIVPENIQILINCLKHLNNLGNIACNYSHTEDMNLALDNWLTADKMIQFIQSEEFIKTSWGDVYVKFV